MIDLRPKVLDYVMAYGPALPVQVSKAINSNILFSSAVLSELVSNRQVFMSNAKIGGSSLYYTKGQEAKLQRLREYLPDMPKKAYDFLKEKLLLRDKSLEPYQRVAFRELKDFAVPITVKYNNEELLFWKWYLVTDEQVNEMIRKELGIKPENQEVKEPIREEKNLEEAKEEKQETLKEKPARLKKIGKEIKADIAMVYFQKNNINVLSAEQTKKNKENAYLVELHSQIGNLSYLACFKDKKKINEEDLILAHHNGQRHKLPVLFLASGELTKAAEELLNKDLKGMMVFKKI